MSALGWTYPGSDPFASGYCTSLLAVGGILVADWDFHQTQDNPMHHELREFTDVARFSDVIESRGFVASGTDHVWQKVDVAFVPSRLGSPVFTGEPASY